jgi:hypothetical protein
MGVCRKGARVPKDLDFGNGQVSGTGVHPEFFLGAGGGRGADPEALYNLYLILKIVFSKSYCKYNNILCNCIYIYIYICIHIYITTCSFTQTPWPVSFGFLIF